MTSEEKRNKIIATAKKEIGNFEFPSNSNKVKYNTWIYGREVFDGDKKDSKGNDYHYPWCGAFVSWVFAEAGLPLGKIDLTKGFVGCPFAVEHVEKWGVIVKDPLPGDIVFYAWKGYKKISDIQHVGIFEKDNGDLKKLTAIEGNTSLKDNSNGGSVMERADRPYSLVAVFVRPNVLINNL